MMRTSSYMVGWPLFARGHFIDKETSYNAQQSGVYAGRTSLWLLRDLGHKNCGFFFDRLVNL